jgi:hypothetical protein
MSELNWGRELAGGRSPTGQSSAWQHYKVLRAIGCARSTFEFNGHEGGFEHAYSNFRRYAWCHKRQPGPEPLHRGDPVGNRICEAIARLVLTVEENPFFGDPDASPRVREVKRRLLSLRKLCIYVDRECGQIESIFPPDEGG